MATKANKKQAAAPSAAAHSPGPWAFTAGDAERRAMSDVFKAGDKTFQIGYVTCEWSNPQQRAEDIANARLFAAAPDLLEACRSMLTTCGGSQHWQGDTHESLKLIEAAIAKAVN